MTSNLNNDSSTNKKYYLGIEQVIEMFKKCFTCQRRSDAGCSLKLPRHIFHFQVKSRNMLHHESVWASLKQNKRNLKKPNPNPNPNP